MLSLPVGDLPRLTACENTHFRRACDMLHVRRITVGNPVNEGRKDYTFVTLLGSLINHISMSFRDRIYGNIKLKYLRKTGDILFESTFFVQYIKKPN